MMSIMTDTTCNPVSVPTIATASIMPEAFHQGRDAMSRFTTHNATLPLATEATCPICHTVVPSRFERIGQQVVLTFECPGCGPQQQVHHDAIWTDVAPDVPGSPTRTFCGSRIHPNARRLPRTVESLCPECSAIIVGRHFIEDGAVYIEKTCPEHGYVRDRISSDALLYSKATWWSFEEPPGLEQPHVTGKEHCPSDCGLCNQHLSGACLAQIDLTNRCNLRCPICFANAGATGVVCELTYDQIVHQLQMLRDLRPNPCTAVQFTGGEPTIHPDFLKVIRTTIEMGFSHIQIATNGLTLADESFALSAAEAGLHTIYLQFDGVGEDAHRETRNHPGIWAKKLAAIENCRKAGMKVCLVPTILKGVNDDQVGQILRFAIDHIDVVSGISYQPVAFTGRIDANERHARRYTLGDLAHDIADATGAVPMRDMFPLSIVVPLAQMLEALTGNSKIRPSCHTDCAFGTYLLISPDGEPYPFPKVINVEGMFTDMNRIAARIRKRGGKANWTDKIAAMRMFKRHFKPEGAPPGLTVKRFIRSLMGMLDKSIGRGESEKLNYKTLLCAGMHFQDRYNFDVERAKRCVILYSTPGGLFPFCTYNCGPMYRPMVERAYSDHRHALNATTEGTDE
jgi:uncharacterized radical SAM superfamily Fe-S cluster-containing enzyme